MTHWLFIAGLTLLVPAAFALSIWITGDDHDVNG